MLACFKRHLLTECADEIGLFQFFVLCHCCLVFVFLVLEMGPITLPKWASLYCCYSQPIWAVPEKQGCVQRGVFEGTQEVGCLTVLACDITRSSFATLDGMAP